MGSEHPLAAAIVEGAREKGLALTKPENFQSTPGLGVSGTVEGSTIHVGNRTYLEQQGVKGDVFSAEIAGLRENGETVIYVAKNGQFAGVLSVSDPVKANAAEAVKKLRAEKIRIVMLTGDDRTTALAVAKKLGIEEVEAGVLPAGKRDVVERLQKQGRIVAMAGDGVNDAPALAQAQRRDRHGNRRRCGDGERGHNSAPWRP